MRLQDDLGYDDWLVHIFAHDDPDWHRDRDAPVWNCEANPRRTVEYVTRAWSDGDALIARFTPNQIGQGVDYLANGMLSNHFGAVLDRSVPFDDRVACIRSVGALYRDCFARICAPVPSHHRSSAPANCGRANMICYMFWDLVCVAPEMTRRAPTAEEMRALKRLEKGEARARRSTRRGHSYDRTFESEHAALLSRRDHEAIEYVCLEVMEATLTIGHIACQEGALHGLGHWAECYPDRVGRIIDQYLMNPAPELRDYAIAARSGGVL